MRHFLLLSILLIGINISAQRGTKVQLVKAGSLKASVYNGKNAQKLTKGVIFKHGDNTMYCNIAYFYNSDNDFDAFGDVRIVDRQGMVIYGDTMHYIGNRALAKIRNNVSMIDKDMTLYTDYLDYFTKSKKAMYFNGGKIVDKDNTLTSVLGYYFSRSKTYHFRRNVVLVNPDYTMYSDTLTFKSKINTAFFNGSTTIISDDNSIFCKEGWYNTGTDQASFNNQALLQNDNQKLWADSLYYDRNIGFGQGFNNVILFDSVKNIIVKGNYAEYYEHGGLSFFTNHSQAIIIDEEKDSLYLHGDTLMLETDTNQEAKTFYVYNHTQFYKSNLQGKCDSLVYYLQDSMLTMYSRPLIWGENSQISGKKIRVYMANGDIDKIYIDTNSFVLQHDSLEYYNQVSGRNMLVHFMDGTMNYVDVLENAQSIYFVREEDSTLSGVNLGASSDMRIEFIPGGVSNIVYLSRVKASLNPVEKLSKRALYLRGFKSYLHWRPRIKEEIFIWEPIND
ncbi:MAG: hypothetical protein KAG84_05810 [Bacteroidales bacterium]|nr:hypothetical protein [Bacteroidales bacterium]